MKKPYETLAEWIKEQERLDYKAGESVATPSLTERLMVRKKRQLLHLKFVIPALTFWIQAVSRQVLKKSSSKEILAPAAGSAPHGALAEEQSYFEFLASVGIEDPTLRQLILDFEDRVFYDPEPQLQVYLYRAVLLPDRAAIKRGAEYLAKKSAEVTKKSELLSQIDERLGKLE